MHIVQHSNGTHGHTAKTCPNRGGDHTDGHVCQNSQNRALENCEFHRLAMNNTFKSPSFLPFLEAPGVAPCSVCGSLPAERTQAPSVHKCKKCATDTFPLKHMLRDESRAAALTRLPGTHVGTRRLRARGAPRALLSQRPPRVAAHGSRALFPSVSGVWRTDS